MKKEIKNGLLFALANANKIAITEYLKTLSEDDKNDALKLIKALKIKL